MPRATNKALGQILPGFWIGRMAAVRAIFDKQTEEEEEWTVVSLMSSETMIRNITETLQEEQANFEHKTGRKLVTEHVVRDMPDKPYAPFVSSRLAEMVRFIGTSLESNATLPVGRDRPKRNCLVHCARGVSRSAAVCAAYLISTQKYSLQTAMEQIQKVRDVNPNLGFLAGLRAIEKCGGDIGKAEERLRKKAGKQNPNPQSPKADQAKKEPEPTKKKLEVTKSVASKENENKANSPKRKPLDEQDNTGTINSITASLETQAPEEGQFSDEVSC